MILKSKENLSLSHMYRKSFVSLRIRASLVMLPPRGRFSISRMRTLILCFTAVWTTARASEHETSSAFPSKMKMKVRLWWLPWQPETHSIWEMCYIFLVLWKQWNLTKGIEGWIFLKHSVWFLFYDFNDMFVL